MNHTPSPEAERNIKTACELILSGGDVDKIVHFIYVVGHTDGALMMARLGAEQLAAALKATA